MKITLLLVFTLVAVTSSTLLAQGRQAGSVAIAEHISSNLVLDSVKCLERATNNNIRAGEKNPAEKASKFCQTSVNAEVKRSTGVANEAADATKASAPRGVVLPGGIGLGWGGYYGGGGFILRRPIGRRQIVRR